MLACLLLPACLVLAGEAPPDKILINAQVYTVNPAQPWAEAVAISDDTLSFVGGRKAALDLKGPDTEVVDLKGQMLLPGFQDSHLHLIWGGQTLSNCSLDGLDRPPLILERLKTCEGAMVEDPERWLVGSTWDRAAFPNGIPPKGFLDEAFAARPVLVQASDGHSYWVNKKALQLAGITRQTLNPKDGVIERDEFSGEPTGLLGAAAMGLIDRVLPETPPEAISTYIRDAIALAHRHGITSAIEPGLDLKNVRAFRAEYERQPLRMRLLLAMAPNGFAVESFGEEIYTLLEENRSLAAPELATNSVKMFIDGVIENGTGALLEPYLGRFERGQQPFYSQADLNRHVQRLDRQGISIHVHAIGDAGVHRTLNAFEALRQVNGPSTNRHVITHLHLVNENDHARFAKLDVTASFSLFWAYMDGYNDTVYPEMIGQERIMQSYPAAALHRAGARIAGASDWAVSSIDPLLAIETGITRRDPLTGQGPALNAEQGLDLETMIYAYTMAVAWLMNNEERTGSIEVGKKADLVLLDRNLFQIPAEDISNAEVTQTLFGGETVYRRERQEN